MRVRALASYGEKIMRTRITRFVRCCVSGAFPLFLLMKPLISSGPAAAFAVCSLTCAFAPVQAGEAARKSYDIASGDAVSTLKRFADESGRQVVFLVDAVRGVTTNAVRGEYTVREALTRLVADTGLVVAEDEKSGALMVNRLASREPPPSQPEPKPKTNAMATKPRTLLAALAGWLAAGAAVEGQTAVTPPNDEAIMLSPFTVSTDQDKGYVATSTLAGTRIKTDLRDLGSAITVITPEFMNDLGATNLEDLLAYTTSTEIGGLQGNFSAADLGANAQRYDLDEQRREPQSGARVRGLFAPNFTRSYFSTSIPIDAYNTGSITISRGANSLLFGLGSAAGVMDNGLSQANLSRNTRDLSLRIGSYGARRETFKINQVLVKNRVALQLAGMEKNEKYRQGPAYDREKRLYGTAEALVFRNDRSRLLGRTIVRGSAEVGRGTRVPPTSLPPLLAWESFFSPPPDYRPYTGQDYLQGYDYLAKNWSRWRTLDTRRIPVTATTFRPGWFESPAIAEAAGTPNLLTPVHSTSHFFEQIGLPYGSGPTPTLGTTGLAGFQGWIAASNQALSPHLATRMYNEGQQGTGFKGASLTDRKVFDFRNQLLTGSLQDIQRKFDAQLVTLEQQLFQGRAGVEGTYGRESYRLDSYQPFGGSGRDLALYIDTTEYLSDGSRNPNVGRAFALALGDREQWRTTTRENRRVTAFADLDFDDVRKGLGLWLGRHRVTGLWQQESRENTGLNYGMFWSGDGFDFNRTIRGANNNQWTASGNQVVELVYLSDDLRGREPGEVRLRQMDKARVRDGDTYNVRYYSRPTGQFTTGTVRANQLATGGVANRTDVTSEALAWQPYLLGRSLVGMIGWRRDTIENFRQIRTNARGPVNEYLPSNLEIADEPATEQEGSTFTWSVVGHVPARWVEKLPVFSGISAHFAKAENFSAIDERHDIFNRPIPNPSGTTTEYGATLGFRDNKWALKLNRFETVSAYSGALSSETAAAITEFTNRWLNGYENGYDDQRTYPIERQAIYTRGYTSYDQFFTALINAIPEPVRSIYAPFRNANGAWNNRNTIRGLASTSDVIAKGWEGELNGNPFPNWRVSLNVVKLETIVSNTGTALADYASQVMANLAAARLIGMPEGVNSIVPFETRFNQQVITGLTSARARDGAVSQEQRKWRVNAVSNFEFSEGRLRGFGVGGSLRWQSKVATGYPVTLDALGNQLPVLERPFYGPAELNGDVWFSYTRKLSDRVRWKAQLNLRNLIGSQEEIPVYTNPDGQRALYRLAPDRNWFLTNTFSF